MTASESGDDSSGDSTRGGVGAQVATLDPDPDLPKHERRFRTFDSFLEVPAFRWYMLSQVGNWSAMLMQMVVRGFLAYELTGSFAALGGVELANSVPRVFLALYGGVIADRSGRRVIIQAGQAANAVIAVIMAALLFAGMLRFEHLLIGAVAQGVINSFVQPARQSMIPEIVGSERLMNAFALNAFGMNTLRLVAPALAGGMIAAFGGGSVFALMAVLYLLAVVTLFRVPDTTRSSRAAARVLASGEPAQTPIPQARRGGAAAERTSLGEIKDALVYLRGQRVLCWLLVLQMFITILSLPYQRLLPGFVREVLAGSAEESATTMGLLLSVTAVGALLGSLLIASLPSRARGKLMIGSLAIFAVGMFAFAASEVVWVSAAIVLVLGVGQAGRQSLVQILIQSNVSDEYRGRVTSIMLLEDGIESLGIFFIAILAEAIGPQLALGAVAVGLLLLSGGIWSMRSIRELE